jgi:uncharacterized protein (TIGR02145 family)
MKTKNRIWIFHLMIMELVLIFTNGCKKETEQGQPPVLTTRNVYSIMPTTAYCGGDITNGGGASVTVRGVCWSTTQNPTIADSKTTDGTGTGTFTSAMTGLTATTTYYVKAYATNSVSTSYGEELSFITYTDVLHDIDGNVYKTMTIGTQEWMAENIKTTKYRNGDLIPTTIPATLDISGESSSEYQWAYDSNESNANDYGRLYTWYAVTDSRNVCPTGWHIPTDAEWTTLTTFLGGEEVAGGKLKETGTSHWTTPNTGATNETSFTALPTGYRDVSVLFVDFSEFGGWWSSTESTTTDAYCRYVAYNSATIFWEIIGKHDGVGVRCTKDL